MIRSLPFSLAVILFGARAPSALKSREIRSRTNERAQVDAGEGGGEKGRSPVLGLSAICDPGLLPDGAGCVPWPIGWDDAPELVALSGGHHDRHGRFEAYEQIPRLPERPADYTAYRYPIGPVTGLEVAVLSGYDLDLPDFAQRRGPRLSHVGHGGVDLGAPRGAAVRSIGLVHQEGAAEVVFVGWLFGNTVVTRHAVREGGRLRDYLLLYGHLAAPAEGLARGARVDDDALVGYVGDSASPNIVHLHLEVRRVRDGLDLSKLPPQSWITNDVSIVCDPRNLLPLKD